MNMAIQLVPKEDSFYELLFHEANDAILLVDQDTGNISAANLRMQELTGFPRKNLVGQPVSILFPNPGKENTRSLRSQLFSKEMLAHSGFYEDMVLLKEDGYFSFASLSVRTLSSGETGGRNVAFCILHDIREKKSMERDLLTKHLELRSAFADLERAHMELKSAQEALVQAGKLAALGELAAGVAHELNQPLLGVMGFGQELKQILSEENASDTARDYVAEILKNAMRMKKIIQQLREFTRKSIEDFQFVEITNVIQESLKLLEQQFRSRGIEVKMKFENQIPQIYCNPFQLEQVFINLATNARDAIEATGHNSGNIDIEVRRKPSDGQRFLEVIYKDDGCGMAEETKNHASEPFFTTKEVGKGTGLGLSVSYGILSKIHASIMIESTPGKGTNFLITIPVDYRNLDNKDSLERGTHV